VVENDLNPVWDETFTFQIAAVDEDVLRIDLFDDDSGDMTSAGGDNTLGEVHIKLSDVAAIGMVEKSYSVAGKNDDGKTKSWAGDVFLKLIWTADPTPESPAGVKPPAGNKQDTGELIVTVREAKDLIDKDTLNKSDPYCVLEIEHDTRKTRTIDNNLHPVWDETFTFTPGTPEEDVLLLTLHDQDEGDMTAATGDDHLGEVRVAIAEVVKAGSMDRAFDISQVRKSARPRLFVEQFLSTLQLTITITITGTHAQQGGERSR
jgi:Ca2+-dependent lipid-binding protein